MQFLFNHLHHQNPTQSHLPLAHHLWQQPQLVLLLLLLLKPPAANCQPAVPALHDPPAAAAAAAAVPLGVTGPLLLQLSHPRPLPLVVLQTHCLHAPSACCQQQQQAVPLLHQ
jgi:hypothetical protein